MLFPNRCGRKEGSDVLYNDHPSAVQARNTKGGRRVYRDFLVAGRRELVERGELFSTSLVALSADAEGEDSHIISHWASKEAHDRNEDNPRDLEAQRAATPFLLTPRSYSEVRHQHVERFVRQALMYGSLTGTLVLLYVSCVFALQMVIHALIGQTSSLVIVASTLAVAAVFQPVRRSIQRMIDHRFYRDRSTALQTLEELQIALQHEIGLTQLSEHILTIVTKTMHPTFASLWLFPLHQANGNRTAPTGSDQISVFGSQIVSNIPQMTSENVDHPHMICVFDCQKQEMRLLQRVRGKEVPSGIDHVEFKQSGPCPGTST